MSNTKNLANLAAALDDGTSGQVLQSTGSGGVTFADSSGSGVTVHANQAAMLTDAASASEGSLHYENNTNKLYVKQSSGFYLLASITNASPTIDSFSEATGGAGANNLTAGGTFTLTSGSNTVITINATEPDLETISYSATVTSGTATDVFSSPSFPVSNQSSNVFTLTPVTSGTGGIVTIRFDASDGTNVANVSHSFEIAFVITNSKYTTLLMATDGSAGDNNDITDSSSNNNTITVYGDAHAGTFSPYRSGGYSTYFDGSGGTLNTTATQVVPTTSFTVAAWVYLLDTTDGGVWAQGTLGHVGRTGVSVYNGAWWAQIGSNPIGTSTSPSALQWYYTELQWDGSTLEFFVDGSSLGSVSVSNTPTNTAFCIGNLGSAWSTAYPLNGYVADVRVVSGTPSGSSTVPTERLTAVTNTKLLTCHLPYIVDGSSNAHAITVNGNVSTKPFGPYDYNEYDKSINGGSVYFDGNGDYLGTPNITMLAADQTVEFWAWHEGTDGDGVLGSISDSSFVIALDNGKPYIWVNSQTLTNISGYTISEGYHAIGNAAVSNGWHHYAYDINVGASTTTLITYVDGAVYGSLSWANASLTARGVGRGLVSPYERYFLGYISDLRVVNSRVYSGAFTPPSGPLTTTGGTYPSTTNVDTSITASNTSLLLSSTDAHVIDKSQVSNLKLVGGAAASTTQAKFSNTASVYFDGNGDYVSVSDLGLSGDITIEGWFYQSVAQSATYRCALGASSYSTNGEPLRIYTYNSIYSIWLANTGGPHISGSFTANTWHHVALVRSSASGTWTLYIDGTSAGTSTTNGTYNFASTVDWTIGADAANTYPFTGYIQDVRITNGLARYTSNFTVPSAPLKG